MIRARRIPTRPHPIKRFWQACDDHYWLPLLIAFVLMLVLGAFDEPQ